MPDVADTVITLAESADDKCRTQLTQDQQYEADEIIDSQSGDSGTGSGDGTDDSGSSDSTAFITGRIMFVSEQKGEKANKITDLTKM